jgi:hypothetical protein
MIMQDPSPARLSGANDFQIGTPLITSFPP